MATYIQGSEVGRKIQKTYRFRFCPEPSKKTYYEITGTWSCVKTDCYTDHNNNSIYVGGWTFEGTANPQMGTEGSPFVVKIDNLDSIEGGYDETRIVARMNQILSIRPNSFYAGPLGDDE